MVCPKCNGKGYIPEYGHIASGVCFLCNGRGYIDRAGKPAQLRLKNVIGTLPGFTRRETFEVIDLAVRDGELFFDGTIPQWVDRAVESHYLDNAIKTYWSNGRRSVKWTFVSTRGRHEFDSLIDWSK